MRIEKGIESTSTLDAEAGAQRAGWVIEPCVDYFGIARGDAFADPRTRLQYDDLESALRERIAAGEAYRPGADDDGIGVEL
jgi:hypothetical protein